MTIERKLLGTSPSGGATDVAEVFSTYLYTGNSGTNVINNGIDLAGEGGMVWFKCRNVTNNHYIVDTERGASKLLYGLGTAAETTSTNSVTSFNSNGFTLGADGTDGINKNTRSQVSWTFRKKKKFFDVVTYTGNGASSRAISHGLDGPVGMMVVKRTSATEDWTVWHKDLTGTSPFISLNSTGGASTAEAIWTSTEPTSTAFTVGSHDRVNTSGHTYVAYLWADNSSEDAEEQMIKCDTYTTNSSGDSGDVDLGWEPQFVLFKNAGGSNNWIILDSMRGFTAPVSGNSAGVRDSYLFPNSSEGEGESHFGNLTSRGFRIINQSSSVQYIYMAIRAPMMIEPEAATDVFGITTRNVANDSVAPEFRSTFPVDMALKKWDTSDPTQIVSRLTQGRYLTTNSTNTEQDSSTAQFDYNNGWSSSATGANTTLHSWMWKRAKGYFDVVAYTGDTNSGRTVAHNLGVAPEMMWVRCRTDSTSWMVYHAAITSYKYLTLDTTAATVTHNGNWYNTNPTDLVFTVGDGATNVAQTQIAYLFATLDGISKVGSYTGNGSNQTIDCGFSAGSRFILIKRTDTTGSWYVWDSVRGIVAGNDPHFSLHTNNGDITNDDSVDPHNSGFIVNQNSATNINVSSGDYIFYAIA